MFRDRRLSLVIPAHNEESTIGAVVAEFRAHALIDEIVVVNNNCTDATEARAVAAGARVVRETARGYGCALRCGMDAATGDLLALVEADGSFRAADLDALLAAATSHAFVVGTRTGARFIQPGARMHGLLRAGNIGAGWMLAALWWHRPLLTDVGCTYRLLDRATWQLLRPHVREAGPAFAPQMVAAALARRVPLTEIPIHYCARAGGESKHSKTWRQIVKTALSMFCAIFRERLSRRVG